MREIFKGKVKQTDRIYGTNPEIVLGLRSVIRFGLMLPVGSYILVRVSYLREMLLHVFCSDLNAGGKSLLSVK